jgi:hypothetical protein
MGLGSGIREKPIPDPGSGPRVKKAPDPGSGSQHCLPHTNTSILKKVSNEDLIVCSILAQNLRHCVHEVDQILQISETRQI